MPLPTVIGAAGGALGKALMYGGSAWGGYEAFDRFYEAFRPGRPETLSFEEALQQPSEAAFSMADLTDSDVSRREAGVLEEVAQLGALDSELRRIIGNRGQSVAYAARDSRHSMLVTNLIRAGLL